MIEEAFPRTIELDWIIYNTKRQTVEASMAKTVLIKPQEKD